MADPKVRLARFTDFVRRAIRDSGMSVEDLAHHAGMGVNTLYLWRSGTQWRDFPTIENVRKFCSATGRNPAEAFAILGPGDEKPAEPEPLELPSDIRKLVQLLRAPREVVPDEQKEVIRATIAWLARQGNLNRDNGGQRDRDVS